MSVKSASVAVGTVAVVLGAAEADHRQGYSVAVSAPTGADLFVGGAGVTAATGFRLIAGSTITLDLGSGETLYGVLASGTGTALVLQTGV